MTEHVLGGAAAEQMIQAVTVVHAAWFGPKGFASVLYGLLILRADLQGGERMFQLIATVTVASIVLHSSSDVLAARWFREAPRPHAGTRWAA